jgi:hypothetical protein
VSPFGQRAARITERLPPSSAHRPSGLLIIAVKAINARTNSKPAPGRGYRPITATNRKELLTMLRDDRARATNLNRGE